MRLTIALLITLLINTSIFAQKEIEAKELSRKEIRALKKQKAFEKQKARYEKRGLKRLGG